MDARRWSAVGLISLGLLIIIGGANLAGCDLQASPGTTSTATATATPSATCARFSPITGACVDANAPVLVVKIDDVGEARPQFHLNEADVILVEPVEGGLTRLFAAYNSTLPETVGPIRSARITDTDLAPMFGNPLFAYSGSQGKLVPYLQQTRMQMVGAPQGGTGYYRLTDRPAPHNYVATVSELLTRVDDTATARLQSGAYWKLSATEPSPTGTETNKVTVRWPAAEKSFIWDAANKRWNIDVYTEKLRSQIDGEGTTERAHTNNVVIMRSTLLASDFGDKFGGRTPYPQTTGSGDGIVLIDGKAVNATWSRPSKDDLPRWFTKSGVEIALRPGNTWWCIVTDLASVRLSTPRGPDTKTATSA